MTSLTPLVPHSAGLRAGPGPANHFLRLYSLRSGPVEGPRRPLRKVSGEQDERGSRRVVSLAIGIRWNFVRGWIFGPQAAHRHNTHPWDQFALRRTHRLAWHPRFALLRQGGVAGEAEEKSRPSTEANNAPGQESHGPYLLKDDFGGSSTPIQAICANRPAQVRPPAADEIMAITNEVEFRYRSER